MQAATLVHRGPIEQVLPSWQAEVQQAYVRAGLGDRLQAFLWRRRREDVMATHLEGDQQRFGQNPLIIADYETHRYT